MLVVVVVVVVVVGGGGGENVLRLAKIFHDHQTRCG